MGICASSPKAVDENNTQKPVKAVEQPQEEKKEVIVASESKSEKPEEKVEAKPEEKPETKPEEKVEAKPEEKVEAKPEEKVEEKVEEVEEKTGGEQPAAEGIVTPEEHQKLLEQGKEYKFKGHDANKKANELHDEANQFKETDKAAYHAKVEESKPFREEAKKYYALSDECQLKVSISQALKAQQSDEPSIDLHGYFLDNAMKCVELSFEYLAKRTTGAKTFLIISGAGNHSDPSVGVKIKPAVIKYLEENKYEFEAANNGSFLVQLKD